MTTPGTAASTPNGPCQKPVNPGPLSLASRNTETQTVTLVLDAAIAAHADEREAHIREVQRYGQTLPADSYGRRNRQAIAAAEPG